MESSRKRHGWAVPLVQIGLLTGCSSPSAQPAQSTGRQPAAAVNPITVDSTEEQIRQAVGTARVGRKLTPKTWPNSGSRRSSHVAGITPFTVYNSPSRRTHLPITARPHANCVGPEPVTEHDDMRLGRLVLVACKRSTEGGADPEHIKVRHREHAPVDIHRFGGCALSVRPPLVTAAIRSDTVFWCAQSR
jgi:hypothetical protein